MTQNSNLISTENLASCLENPDIRIIDCRFDLGDPAAGRRAYEAGHIRGAVFADLDNDLSAPIRPDSGRHPLPEVSELAATLGEFGIGPNTDVIVYDAGAGALAARAWWLLRWMGHDRVRLLDGGFEQWLAEARPVVAGEERAKKRVFAANPRGDRIVTTDELVGNSAAISELKLIDARDTARFLGEVEPIDAVAGHIPGSINLPYTRSLDQQGRWRSREELELLWSSVLGEDTEASWIAMCGSGVTACHLAISALQAGYREPRLYVGSWSEWIRDPKRPVAVGEGPDRPSRAADLA